MSRRRIYYPEGKIQKGLYTIGKAWMFEDGIEYIGSYHTYSTGEVYSQSSYIRNVSRKLIPYRDVSQFEIKSIFDYDGLPKKETLKEYFSPYYNKTQPQESDYFQGFFDRYFVKSLSTNIIFEVSLKDYQRVQKENFQKTIITWKLTGPINDTNLEPGVEDTNRRLVNLAEREITGIVNYITNFTEYKKI